MWILAAGILLVLLAAVAYWAIILTEGAYLGQRVVTWLYDWGARTYDEVKGYDIGDEAHFLGQPLMRALAQVWQPLILDVGTGTGRLPLALLRRLEFDGRIVGLDSSSGMLREAHRKTARYGRLDLVCDEATNLPFIDQAFDAVTCIEALEFFPDRVAALREMVRVLKPGGLLLLSNRVGRDALYLPGRAYSRERFEGLLKNLGLTEVETQPWQEYYDLIWARKPGVLAPTKEGKQLLDVLRCPRCTAFPLLAASDELTCRQCGRRYPRQAGWIDLETDRGRFGYTSSPGVRTPARPSR